MFVCKVKVTNSRNLQYAFPPETSQTGSVLYSHHRGEEIRKAEKPGVTPASHRREISSGHHTCTIFTAAKNTS